MQRLSQQFVDVTGTGGTLMVIIPRNRRKYCNNSL